MDDLVAAALDAVPRAGFLPPGVRHRADYDGPLGIGHGQTSSQPRTVVSMLRLLQVRRGDRVLDVGAGSGWTTALLAHLIGPEGHVLGLELVPELASWGARNLAAAEMPWAELRLAPAGVLGVPGRRFDRVLVSADAAEWPEELVDQLADEGRMVVPVRGTMTLVVRRGEDLEITEHGSYRFVPLLRG